MNTNICSRRDASRNRDNQSLQLAGAIRTRREQLLKMSIQQAAELAGLTPEQWSELEAGWIPAMDNTLWIWWTLAGTLQVKVDTLFRLASVDLARQEMLKKQRAAA